MSVEIHSSNRFWKGVLFLIALLSYAYYFNWLNEKLEIIVPKWAALVIVFLLPIVAGVTSHVTGLFIVSIKYRKRIVENIKRTGEDYDQYGVTQPILNYKLKLEKILESISETHFLIDDQLLVGLYTEGLSKVKERFWTTTYLTSGFWAHGKYNVISANKSMLERLNANEKKTVQRLFLLRHSEKEEIKNIAGQIFEFRRLGEYAKIKQKFQEFNELKEHCAEFKKYGCEIRYLYDEIDHSHIGITRNNIEIAIYDDFRIDYFDGSDDARITGIKVFTEKHTMYKEKKSEIMPYFKQLWSEARDIDLLFREMEKALYYYNEKINYTIPRLIRFDHDTHRGDAEVKAQEIETVIKFLESKRLFNKIKNYLDVGTCTGRYPFKLSEDGRLKQATIFAVDADEECIEYCNIQKDIREKDGQYVKNILFKQLDFIKEDLGGRKFDLITCMLGTISHFGWNKMTDHNDDLQQAIDNMSFHLAKEGYLIIGNWTEFGLDGRMLDIYDNVDREKLLKFSERTEALINRLSGHFNIKQVFTTPNKKIDILICEHN